MVKSISQRKKAIEQMLNIIIQEHFFWNKINLKVHVKELYAYENMELNDQHQDIV